MASKVFANLGIRERKLEDEGLGKKSGCELEARRGPAAGVMCRRAEAETGQSRPDAACRPVSLGRLALRPSHDGSGTLGLTDSPALQAPSPGSHDVISGGAQTVGRAAPSWGALVSTCQRESATHPMGGPTAPRPSSSDCEALLDILRWSPLGIEGWRCHSSSDHRQQEFADRIKWTDPRTRLSQTLITRACPAANVSTLPDSESN